MKHALRFALLLLAATSCKGKEAKAPPEAPEVMTKADSTSLMHVSASLVLSELAALESEKDVTCWTSFRQLDWFIAEKSYDEYATLAKVHAIKALVRAAWSKASATSSGANVSAADIAAVIALPSISLEPSQSTEFAEFTNDIGLKNYTDYQKTAEHWRVVLAVVQDELYETGGKPQLKPLRTDGLQSLADVTTTLSLMLLKESAAAAEENQSEFIGGEHVKTAYHAIATAHDLGSAPRTLAARTGAVVKDHLQPLTRSLLDGKYQALKAFNSGSKGTGRGPSNGPTAQGILEDLNRVARMPVTADAVALLQRQLQSFVHFVAAGYDPMRSDNYLSDGSFASTDMVRKGYLGTDEVQNAVMQLFPHRMMNNGDIVVRFEPNPGPMTKMQLEPIEIRILDHEMNGVRDSGIHWLVARTVWDERPFAMDPFAAEYLTEVVSMMMATWMHRGEQLAKEMGKTEVDAEVAKRIQSKLYVMVQPNDPSAGAWLESRAAAKPAALAEYGPKGFFTDETKASGLPATLADFDEAGERIAKDGSAAATSFDLQTIMGGGIAVGDVNGDGYEDLYLTGESLGRLYLNDGKARPGHFADATKAWGLPEIDDGHGTLFFDFEGDGDQDLLVLRSKNPSALFLQDKGTFTDAAQALGLATHYGAHVGHVFDYDRDGDLDIFVGYYGSKEAHAAKGQARSQPSMDGRNGSENQLWRNDGDALVEVAKSAGVADVGWALAAGSFDYDLDGYLDLYLANDFGANAMFRNRGDGTFEDVTEALGTGDRGSGMNVDVADVNHDGKWDFYVTNIDMFSKNIKVVFPRDESTIDISQSLTRAFQYLTGNKLYISNAEGGFTPEEHLRFEPHDRGWGWDAAFMDVDNDGDQDLYVTNGWVQGSYAGGQKNQLYINHKDAFYLAPETGAEAFAGNTRSSAAVDIDNDGDLDIVANNFRQGPRVLRNNQRSANRWVRLALQAKGKNPKALGARVVVSAGKLSQMRQSSGGRGYLSQASSVLSLGVGSAKTVDVEVFWPDGTTSKATGLATNKQHALAQE
tara:strand:- start:9643 stop:12753 length:3111 start_codon:yes stop_codon:yes gene_type:complete